MKMSDGKCSLNVIVISQNFCTFSGKVIGWISMKISECVGLRYTEWPNWPYGNQYIKRIYNCLTPVPMWIWYWNDDQSDVLIKALFYFYQEIRSERVIDSTRPNTEFGTRTIWWNWFGRSHKYICTRYS